MKIYTKTGDNGTTGLFAGGRVSKTHPRVKAYGTVDELNSHLGVARAAGSRHDDWLRKIQTELFHLGADLATPLDAQAEHITRIEESAVTWLEEKIDQMTGDLPPLENFILPGGVMSAAQLHVARTVCRRAERDIVSLAELEPVNEVSIVYLNRLSDFLFTLARVENLHAGTPEEKWTLVR